MQSAAARAQIVYGYGYQDQLAVDRPAGCILTFHPPFQRSRLFESGNELFVPEVKHFDLLGLNFSPFLLFKNQRGQTTPLRGDKE